MFNKYFVVFGGRNNKLYSQDMKTVALNDLHLFDFHKEVWVTVAMFGDYMPDSRWSPTLVSSSDKLILLGGMNLTNYCNNAVFEMSFDQKEIETFLEQKVSDYTRKGQRFDVRDSWERISSKDEVNRILNPVSHLLLLGFGKITENCII